MTSPLFDDTVRHLSKTARLAQIDTRTPGFVAGVARRGELLWHEAIGCANLADPSVPLGPDTQYLVASNTKTFTAVLVMMLRDEGRIDLDDTIGTHLPELRHGQVTVRQMLAHASGMQREPVGDVWDTLEFPTRADLTASWNDAERVLKPHYTWHYSNLCYAILGELIARLDDREWGESLQARLLDPLGLHRTTLELVAPHTAQYWVGPYTDVPSIEPIINKKATAAAGSVCSTLADMIRWHAFLLDPDPAVISPDSIDEMRRPQIMAAPDWSMAWGLGLQLIRREGRTWFGHTGGLPGGITGFFSEPESGVTAAVLMNNTASTAPAAHAIDLGAYVVAHDPEPISPWVPGTIEPPELMPLVGQWFSEGNEHIFFVEGGRLKSRLRAAGTDAAPSVFEPIDADRLRTVSGPEQGEQLVIRRRTDGSVAQLNWATYKFTREAIAFGDPDEH